MRRALFTAMLAAVPALASAQTPSGAAPGQEPIVQVGLFGYDADGTPRASAYDTAPSLTSTVYAGAPCVMGAGSRKPPANATDVWEFIGKVLSTTGEEAVIQLEWRRTMADGKPVNHHEGSTQLTLPIGQPVLLDQIAREFSGNCPTVVNFEARYAPRPWASRTFGAGRRGAGGAGLMGSSGGAVRVGGAARLFKVDLWLVHSVPGKPDDVGHAVLTTTTDGGSFAFPPQTVTTTAGAAIAQVSGSFTIVKDSNGEDQLVFSMSRRIVPTSQGPTPRDMAPDVQGSTRVTNAMPGPDEVLSFEMPPIRIKGQLAAPDQFSVRLKIAPR